MSQKLKRNTPSDATRRAFLMRITAREFLRGQYIWMGVAAQVMLITSIYFFSVIGLDDHARIFDQFAYFLTLTLTLFVSSLIGSGTWKRDAAKTGLCEIVCNRSFRPAHFFLTRTTAQALGLILYQLGLFALYASGLWLAFPERFASTLSALPVMCSLGIVYALLSLATSSALGVFVRPPLAQFGTLLLFTAGTLSESLTQVASLGGPSAEEARSGSGHVVLAVMQWWRPQVLIVQAKTGHWQLGTPEEIALAAGWGLLACGFFATVGAAGARVLSNGQTGRWGQ